MIIWYRSIQNYWNIQANSIIINILSAEVIGRSFIMQQETTNQNTLPKQPGNSSGERSGGF